MDCEMLAELPPAKCQTKRPSVNKHKHHLSGVLSNVLISKLIPPFRATGLPRQVKSFGFSSQQLGWAEGDNTWSTWQIHIPSHKANCMAVELLTLEKLLQSTHKDTFCPSKSLSDKITSI